MIRKTLLVSSPAEGLGATTFSILLSGELAALGYKIRLMDTSIESVKLAEYLGYSSELGLEFTNNGVELPASEYGFSYVSPYLFMHKDPAVLMWDMKSVLSFIEDILFNVNWGEVDILVLKLPYSHLNLLGELQSHLPGKIRHSLLFLDYKFRRNSVSKMMLKHLSSCTKVLSVCFSPSVRDDAENSARFSFNGTDAFFLPFVGELMRQGQPNSGRLEELMEAYSPIIKEVAQNCLSIFSD
ncbi:MAG: tyrosine-protein kinase family protein [Oligoflexia bacterium]|nr:tyrosine-protein kinase family protein [Oligoflexia bacterium]